MALASTVAAPRTPDKRLVLAGLLLALVAVAFWTGSRYPALNDKALMGGEADVEGIAFNRVIDVDPAASAWERIGANAVNWAYTNKQGMTFGVLFAALVLTVLPLVSKRQFEGRMANTLLGVAMGAPLGVCVNCAVPIAEGLHKAGSRGETTIAALMSSPTLNVVVLSMTFAMFPFWMAALKLGLTLAFIVLAVPVLVGLLWHERGRAPSAAELAPAGPALGPDLPAAPALDQALGPDVPPATWAEAAAWTVRSLARNLWYIVKVTVPLMLLAGALGAVVVTFLPWDTLANGLPEIEPTRATTRSLLALGAVALLGTFLPVPIAFDVIICAILGAAGLPLPYVVVLFVTLGVFSAYPFLQIWRTMSKKMAVGLFLGVAALGLCAGWTASVVQPRIETHQRETILAAFAEAGEGPVPRPTFPTTAYSAADVAALTGPLAIPSGTPRTAGGVTIERVPFQTAGGGGAAPGPMAFTRFAGVDLGLDEPSNISANRFIVGVNSNRAAASGDVNGDGWPDLAFTSEAGVSLYANVGGERFVRQEVAVPAFDTLYASGIALVDLDGDGALDLYVATIGGGNHVVYNDGGTFTEATHVVLPNLPGAYRSTSVGFGDVDLDGDLDLVLGNVVAFNANAPRRNTKASLSTARNALLINEGGRGAFEARPLPGVPGETLSVLLSDLDGDGDLDLVVGNDFVAPDLFYEGDGDGGFRLLTRQDGIVPVAGLTTMNVASADLDNDLTPEVFIAQISRTADTSPRLAPRDACAERPEAERAACERARTAIEIVDDAGAQNAPDLCLTLGDAVERGGCLASYATTRRRLNLPGDRSCEPLAQTTRWPLHRTLCGRYEEALFEVSPEEAATFLPWKKGDRNVLLHRTDAGPFTDLAATLGLEKTGWTWNARFADFDQDGWQDLYVSNGTMLTPRSDRNLLFRNREGQGFEEIGEAAGATSWIDAYAHTTVDYDLDGDLDVIVPSTMGPVDVYRNEAAGRAVQFALRDTGSANPYAVGAVVVIRYGDGAHQMREVQSSGGFLSFDEPVVHFGLGDHTEVTEVEVRWPTGERTRVTAPFAAGARYTIRR